MAKMITRSAKAAQQARTFTDLSPPNSSRRKKRKGTCAADLEEELANPNKSNYNEVREALIAARADSARKDIELVEKTRELREKDRDLAKSNDELRRCNELQEKVRGLQEKVRGSKGKEKAKQTDDQVNSGPREAADRETKATPGEEVGGETKATPGEAVDGETTATPGEEGDGEIKATPGERVGGETKATPADGMLRRLKDRIYEFATTYFAGQLQQPLEAQLGLGWAEQYMRATTPGDNTYMDYLHSQWRCSLIIEAFIWRFLCGTIFDRAPWSGSEEMRHHVSGLQALLSKCKWTPALLLFPGR